MEEDGSLTMLGFDNSMDNEDRQRQIEDYKYLGELLPIIGDCTKDDYGVSYDGDNYLMEWNVYGGQTERGRDNASQHCLLAATAIDNAMKMKLNLLRMLRGSTAVLDI